MNKLEGTLYTDFGQMLLDQMEDANFVPLPEYPRPQMVRDSYLCLNGWWDYSISRTQGESTHGKILVPFSPEAPLSQVNQVLMPKDSLHYSRSFQLEDHFNQGRVILHFDAVDYHCVVRLNGQIVGEHKGGFYAFELDITPYLAETNLLEVEVQDPTDTSYIARGKQKLKRGTIWYSAQSGIWQTVWLESVPEEYVESFRILPDIDQQEVAFVFKGVVKEGTVIIKDDSTELVRGSIIDHRANIPFSDFILWSPENPKLYQVEIQAGKDRIKSYFGMRKFSLGLDKQGQKRLFLNNQPYFHNGVLDQGYYPDGFLTPPSDDAMIYDIKAMKNLGFNMLRKHIKIEPLRWYYHCDRLGMIVWQDMVNGGKDRVFLLGLLALLKIPCRDSWHGFFGRGAKAGREEYWVDAMRTVDHLYNVTSIGMWVPFNEAWGQFDGDKVGQWLSQEDSSRTIDRYSGWMDQGRSDFSSLHIYFRAFKVPKFGQKCLVLSEFGGYSCKEPGHYFMAKKDFGYKKFAHKEQLSKAYEKLFSEEIIPAVAKGLSATVYTQLTDVEDEVNGILTYDRKVQKISSVQGINQRLDQECAKVFNP